MKTMLKLMMVAITMLAFAGATVDFSRAAETPAMDQKGDNANKKSDNKNTNKKNENKNKNTNKKNENKNTNKKNENKKSE